MISLYASIKFLNNMKLNERFIDDAIEEGIDRYNDYINSPTPIIPGSSVKDLLNLALGTNTETPHVNVDEIIASVFDWRNGGIYRHLKTTDTNNINQINQNWSEGNFVCIVTIPPETYSIFFDKVNNYVYLFDSHGRSSIFNDWNDFSLTFVSGEGNPYANSNSYIVRGNTFDDIIGFINKNDSLPERAGTLTALGDFAGNHIICNYLALEN